MDNVCIKAKSPSCEGLWEVSIKAVRISHSVDFRLKLETSAGVSNRPKFYSNSLEFVVVPPLEIYPPSAVLEPRGVRTLVVTGGPQFLELYSSNRYNQNEIACNFEVPNNTCGSLDG